MDSPSRSRFSRLGQGLKSGNNLVVRAIQFLTAGAVLPYLVWWSSSRAWLSSLSRHLFFAAYRDQVED